MADKKMDLKVLRVGTQLGGSREASQRT